MDNGISAQLMLSLAANEAAAAHFEFIEPEHMLCGLLKLSELKKQDLEKLVKHPERMPELEDEQQELLRLFAELGMKIPYDTKRKRDKIRARMGKGKGLNDGQALFHCSETSQDICDRAAQIAQSTGAAVWKAVHVAAALKERGIGDGDEPEGRKAGERGGPKKEIPKEVPKEPVATPLLDQYGTKHQAENDKQNAAATKDPVVKVLRELVEANPNKAIILIEEGGRPASEILNETAQLAFDPEILVRLASVPMQRVIDSVGDTVKIVSDLFPEASEAGYALCFIADSTEYQQMLGMMPALNKLLWPIWIHKLDHIAHS